MGFKMTRDEDNFTTLDNSSQTNIVKLRELRTVIWCFVITAIVITVVSLGGCWMDGHWKAKGLEEVNGLPTTSGGFYKHPKQNLLDKAKELLK